MQLSGRTAVVGIFAVAIAMAAGAWRYRVGQSRRCLGLWGAKGAQAIAAAPAVTLWKLQAAEAVAAKGASRPDAEARAESVRFARGVRAVRQRELESEPGLVHLRYALTQDANYDWDAEPTTTPAWGTAVEFHGGGAKSWAMLFSDDFQWVQAGEASTDDQPRVLACPRLAEPLRRFLQAEAAGR